MLRYALLLCALASSPAFVQAHQATLANSDAPPMGGCESQNRNCVASAPRDPVRAADSLEIRALARRLTRDAATDSAKAAALYEWVARNVAYDVDSYRQQRTTHSEPESVYRHRLALCGGFVLLYARLAAEAGLRTETVIGYAKGFDHVHGRSTDRPNHAWLAVSVNGAWRLLDPTWGAGMIADGRFTPLFSWDYFLVNPEELLLSHLPEDAKWQLVARPLRRSQFERMPAVPRELLGIGFTAAAIRSAGESRVDGFPVVGVPAARVRVMDAPISGKLRRATAVPVRIEWPSASDVALVTGGQWFPLARAGNIFQGQAVAASGPLYVVGRTSATQPYHTLLLYRVD